MKKKTAEGMLIKSVRDLLNACHIFHWKNFGGPLGVVGVPDILGIYKGRMIGLELKAPKGVVSPAQQHFIDKINEEGGIAFVVRTLDDVIVGLGLQDRFLDLK